MRNGPGKQLGEHILVYYQVGRRYWKNYCMEKDVSYQALLFGRAVATGRKRKVKGLGRIVEYENNGNLFWIDPETAKRF